MQIIFMILLIPFLFGCTVSQYELIDNDHARINYEDGISLKEAETIAQKELMSKRLDEGYFIFAPKVLKKLKKVPNAEDYWFITFDEKFAGRIEVVYLVAVSKKDGEIVYSRKYFVDKEWILEAHFLRLDSP